MNTKGQSDNQPELFRIACRKDKSELSVDMLKILLDRGCWMHRKDFASLGWNDRECRIAVQYSKGQIISTDKGYKASILATIEELDQAAATIQSTIQSHQEKLKDLWAVIHRKAGATQTEKTA